MTDLFYSIAVLLRILLVAAWLILMAVSWLALPVLLVMWLLLLVPTSKLYLLSARRLFTITVASVMMCLVSIAWPIRPFIFRGRQVTTYANMNTVCSQLGEAYQSSGR